MCDKGHLFLNDQESIQVVREWLELNTQNLISDKAFQFNKFHSSNLFNLFHIFKLISVLIFFQFFFFWLFQLISHIILSIYTYILARLPLVNCQNTSYLLIHP